jgi:hypothetical protein
MKVGDVASALGKGLVAGAIGTVAMTLSQRLAQRLVGQEPSSTPAKAVEKVVGVEPKGQQEEERLTNLTHFAYGTAWGVPRGLLAVVGLGAVPATLLHIAAVQASAMTMLPALHLAPRPREWPRKEVALEVAHHAVYAVAASVAFVFLDRRSERARLSTS